MLLSGNHWSTVYANPTLLVVDSGGYELNPRWGEGDIVSDIRNPLSFNAEAYERLVDRLPTDFDLLVVNYDHVHVDANRADYIGQVGESARFFETRDCLMSDILLRPPRGQNCLDTAAIESVIPSLSQFNVVGVTEKEAGESFLDRLVTIARLRRLLDEASIALPIHVFGVLDPLLVTLYFMAGAELFDGLTWLRFGHHNGLSVYRETVDILKGRVDMSVALSGVVAQLTYLETLRVLKRKLQYWVENTGDVACLDHHQGEVQSIRLRLEEAAGVEIG